MALYSAKASERVDPGAQSGAAPAAAPVKTGSQQLSQGQMAGIILIEGDKGAATGFMTKIRDVDFVVTNLHVLGTNKKITLKNLRGEEVPFLAIFGAVGSDIAILRIGKGEGDLKVAADVFKAAKIGDQVVVTGNRLGGGVATETLGQVVGVGPTRVEVNADFAPGNSGSPIFSVSAGEVIGVATYATTRKVDLEESEGSSRREATAEAVDKRWFGYRLDSVQKWEQIDMAKWRTQRERIEKFRETSEALVDVVNGKPRTGASKNARVRALLENFDTRARRLNDQLGVMNEVKDFFRAVRALAEDGQREIGTQEFYDYFHTCLYWETSVKAQVEYRSAIIEALKRREANATSYISSLRN